MMAIFNIILKTLATSLLSCLCSLTLVGCAQNGATTSVPSSTEAKLTSFPLPQLPVMMSNDPDARLAYLARHYWDNYPFADTTLISNSAVTEHGLADFIDLIRHLPRDVAEQSITTMIRRAEADSSMYRHFVALSERYLYDPNSPYRSDDLYIPVLNQVVGSTLLRKEEKIRPRYQLKMAMKNRVGSRAADFEYKLTNGKRGRLYKVAARYTLLFFNNPDCAQCDYYKKYIVSSPLFTKWVAEAGSSPLLRVLAIYPDQEIELWRKAVYPKEWINGSSPGVADGKEFDVPAIPSLYLLDKDKKVILKDAEISHVEEYLLKQLEPATN